MKEISLLLLETYGKCFKQDCYQPGSYLCIDEQLIGFRRCAPFRVYVKLKPDKYGLKIWVMADTENASAYDSRYNNIDDDVVLRHTLPIFTGLGQCPIVKLGLYWSSEHFWIGCPSCCPLMTFTRIRTRNLSSESHSSIIIIIRIIIIRRRRRRRRRRRAAVA